MPVLTEPSQRPTCMPGTKDEGFLPRISQRGSSSDSDSLQEYKRGRITRVPSSAATSVSSSPVKLPAINGKSKSNSVSSLSNGTSPSRAKEERAMLCRSPSCPSNIGYWYERDLDFETPTPDGKGSGSLVKRDSGDLRLPNIKDRNSMCSGSSQSNGQTFYSQRSPTRNVFSRDLSPAYTRRDMSLSLQRDAVKDSQTPRAENGFDSQRSVTQSALLLPIRNSESRISLKKRKKKKKNRILRQNADPSINPESGANIGACDNIDRLKHKMETISSREYCSDAEDFVADDDRFITQVKDENVVSRSKESVVNVKKRHKLKKRMTDNNLYFERELTQVNA